MLLKVDQLWKERVRQDNIETTIENGLHSLRKSHFNEIKEEKESFTSTDSEQISVSFNPNSKVKRSTTRKFTYK